MIPFLIRCARAAGTAIPRPQLRPVTRIRQVTRWVAGASVAAKVGAGAGGAGLLACVLVPVWFGSTPSAPAAPRALPTTSAYGGWGGSVYGALDRRDYAALVVPGRSILPPGDVLMLLPTESAPLRQPVSVPEPSSLAILAGAIAGIVLLYRRPRLWTPTGRTEQAHTLFGLRPYQLIEVQNGSRRRWVRA